MASRTSFVLLLLSVFCCAALADEPAGDSVPAETPESSVRLLYDLKYKFKPGEAVRTEVVFLATVENRAEGVSSKAESRAASVKLWQIGEVTGDGRFSFTHSVESVDMWQKTQGRPEVRYNSLTDEKPPVGHEEFADAIGVPLTVATMDDRGRILKRIEKRPQPMSISTQMTMPLPAEPVAVGAGWSTPLEIDVVLKDGNPKKINTRQQFKLTKVVDDVATIEIDTQVLSPVTDPAIEAQLIQRMSKGWAKFDIAAGRVLQQQLELDRHVTGHAGPTSSMHYVSRFTERLLTESEVAARQKATVRK